MRKNRILWAVLGVFLFLSGCSKVEKTPQIVEVPKDNTDIVKIEEENVFGAVPYFRDDTGRDAQLADGYLYGYWAGRLCRYNVKNNYQEEILYDTGTEQAGAFCIHEGSIYFLTEPTVSTLTSENTCLYKMNCDGSGLVLLWDKIPDLEDNWYHYDLDIYEDIIYVYDEYRTQEPMCYQLEATDSVVPVSIEQSIYGEIPDGFEEVNRYLPALPYMLRNYGFVLLENQENESIYAYDFETGTLEKLNFGNIQVDMPSFFMTHDAICYCEEDRYSYATQWYRLPLDNLQAPEKWMLFKDMDYESWVFWGEEQVYFIELDWETDRWMIYEAGWETETARWVSGSCKSEEWNEASSVFAGKCDMWYWDGEAFYYNCDGSCCDNGFAGQDCIIKDTLAGNKRVISVYNEEPNSTKGVCDYKTEKIIYGLEDSDGEYADNQLRLIMEKAFLKGDCEANSQINQYLETEYDKLSEEMLYYAERWEEIVLKDDVVDEVIAEEDYVELTGSELEIDTDITYIDEKYVVFRIMRGGYWSGAAHPNYYYTHYVFDRVTGERLTILDVLNKTSEEICDIIAPYVEKDYEFTDWTTRESILEQNRLFLTEDGIGIFYNCYDIASYSEGIIEFVIPYSVFK